MSHMNDTDYRKRVHDEMTYANVMSESHARLAEDADEFDYWAMRYHDVMCRAWKAMADVFRREGGATDV